MGCRFIALNGGKYVKAKWGAEINAGDYISADGFLHLVKGVLDTVNIEEVSEFMQCMGMVEAKEVEAIYVSLAEDWRFTP